MGISRITMITVPNLSSHDQHTDYHLRINPLIFWKMNGRPKQEWTDRILSSQDLGQRYAGIKKIISKTKFFKKKVFARCGTFFDSYSEGLLTYVVENSDLSIPGQNNWLRSG